MKKRVKLLTTIASLCLAVALMAFGVYAASSATLVTTSTVAFKTNNVHVQLTADVAYTNCDVAEDSQTTTEDLTFTSTVGGTESVTATDGKFTYTRTQMPNDEDMADTINLGDYTFNDDAVATDTVVYTFTFVNLSTGNDYVVTVTEGVEELDSTMTAKYKGISIKVTGSTFTEGKAELKPGADNKVTYVVTVTLDNVSNDIDANTIAPKFAVTKKTA